MKSDYNTKQRKLIEEFIKNSSEHITAARLVEELAKKGEKVGTATVYRHLEKLVDCGLVRKYITDGGACYQYADAGCENHFHLKCTSCGTLFHVDCSFLEGLAPHILEHHGFDVDNRRTVMYGICKNCRNINI